MKKLLALLMTLIMALTMVTPAMAEGPTEVANAEGLEAAFAAGGSIKLTADIELTTTWPIKGDLTIDGNGKTITFAFSNDLKSPFTRAIYSDNNVNEGLCHSLTASNLTIKNTNGKSSGYGALVGKGDAEFDVSFTGCTFENLWCGVMLNGCNGSVAPDVTVSSCTFTNTNWGVSYSENDYIGEWSVTGSNGLDVGCERENYSGKPVAQVGTTYHTSLADAVAAAQDGETVTLLKDITAAGYVVIPEGKKITIDGNGHTYSFQGYNAFQGHAQVAQMGVNTKLTLKNTTFKALTADTGVVAVTGFTSSGSEVVFDNCTFNDVWGAAYANKISDEAATGTVTIKNCTYKDNCDWLYGDENKLPAHGKNEDGYFAFNFVNNTYPVGMTEEYWGAAGVINGYHAKGYTTLKDAIEKAVSGETVVLLANNDETDVTLKVGVPVDTDGKTMTEPKAPENYVAVKNGNIWTLGEKAVVDIVDETDTIFVEDTPTVKQPETNGLTSEETEKATALTNSAAQKSHIEVTEDVLAQSSIAAAIGNNVGAVNVETATIEKIVTKVETTNQVTDVVVTDDVTASVTYEVSAQLAVTVVTNAGSHDAGEVDLANCYKKITVTLPVPSDWEEGSTVYVTHVKGDGVTKYYHKCTVEEGNIIRFDNYNGFSTFTLSSKKPTDYPSSSGGGSYTPSGHYVTSPFDGVDKVYVDGALVATKNYTTSGGNVTLLQSYLDGLKAGSHTIKIVYGTREATGTFTTKGTGTVQSAKTFDAGIALYGMMALASAAGAVYVTKKR